MGKGVSLFILQIEMGHLGGWGTWAMGYTSNGTHGQRSIIINTADRDVAPWGWGTWVMGHMGNGAHGQLATWA